MSISHRLAQNLRSFLLPVAASFLIFSCTDSGCVDADDFGEYESQTITVTSNAQQENCSYDSSLGLTDSTQGNGIKTCLTAGTTTVTNESGESKDSTTGCSGFTDAVFQNICINNCVQSCLSSVGSSNSAGAEPTWTSTDKKIDGQNSGVTIRPGSQVIVRATGNVALGNSVGYPDLFLKASDPNPSSYDSTWKNRFFDVRNGQSLTLSFSGLVYAGSGTNTPLGQTNTSSDLYNLAKRLVVYTIDHPENYGGIDATKTNEKEASKTVPLLPEDKAWKCNYSGSDPLESTCDNASYVSLGYTNVNDGLANSTFPISSASKSSSLTLNGGVIRWTGDGLNGTDFDPFFTAGVVCDSNGACKNINSVTVSNGLIIGDISSAAVSIQNTYNDAYAVSFRSLTGNAACNSGSTADTKLSISITDSSDNPLYSFVDSVSISDASWTTDAINLEPGHKIVISQKSNFKYNGTGINCGRDIGIRYLKYQDLTMDQSAFVRFFILGGDSGSVSGSCNIKGRIINPSGSHTDFNGAGTADFYEYGTYNSSSGDPLASLPVSPALNGSPSFSPGSSASTNQVFVRKGQKIRFYPDSWNGSWTNISGSKTITRKCGVGMAMKVIPRPALLCRGKVSESVSNPACSPQLGASGSLMGCQATSSECYESNSSQYCTYSDCLDVITCNESGTSSNNYTRTCAFSTGSPTVPSAPESIACTTTLNNSISSSDPNKAMLVSSARTRCKSCAASMLRNGNQSALISVSNISQCYDLENYSGKVSNIPANPASITEVTNFLDGAYSKGATKLNGFNGRYGNIAGFSDSGTTSTGGKKVYNANSTYTVSADSRLRLLLLDGETFLDPSGAWTSYSDNTNPSGDYSGSNGIKVGFSGSLEFKNGQWMQVLLCKENSSDSYLCKSMTTPADFAASGGQPEIINIAAPTSTDLAGADPNLSTGGSNYNFDSSGNLYRTNAGKVAGDCTMSAAGSTFYCHTHNYYSVSDLEGKNDEEKNNIENENKKLRLTFKILDPEIGNCNLTGTNDGIKVANPYYNSGDAANIGAVCGSSDSNADTPGDGSDDHPGTCQKESYCASKYSNNSGQYYVNVKVKSDITVSISSIISAVITPVLEVMDGKRDDPTTLDKDESTDGQAERVYKSLITDWRYKSILTVSLVVMLTFYGVGYLLGVSELNHAEIFGRVLKIGFIYLMVGETGWDWFKMFFVSFFKDGTDYLSFMMASSFDDSSDIITNAITSGDFYDKSVLFSSIDNVLNLFFAPAVQKKLAALLFASIFGWAYLLIIWWSFISYAYAAANAVLLYLTAQVFISILFVVGPIFFIFLLFNQTKEMFDNWIKQLIGFSLQQIFLLITLAFFNMLMYEVIKMSLGYKVCWEEVWVMNLGITKISLMSFWTIASLPPRTNANSQVGNIGNPEGIPSIFTILFIWVVASLMGQFIGFMTDIAASISGGLKASEMGAEVGKGFAALKSKVVDPIVNRVYGETVGRAAGYLGDKLDDKLFDSGETADKRRADAEEGEIKDRNNKNAMEAAGAAAASEFRKNNPFMPDGKEKDKKAAEAAEAGMRQKAKDMGLNSNEADRLMNDKGFKTAGSKTVFDAAYKAFKSRSTANESLADKAGKEGGRMTTGEARDAMKGMSSAERKEFSNKAGSGEIPLKTSMAEDVFSGKKSAGDVAKSAASKAASGAGSALNMGLSAAAQMVTGGNVNIAQSLEEMSGLNKGLVDAEKQLEKEGAIDTMAPGSAWTRDGKQKDMIRQRAAQNKKESSASVAPAPDLDAAAGILREAEHLDEMDNINDREDIGNVGKAARKMGQKLGTAFNKLNPDKEAQSRKKYKAQAAKNSRPATDVLDENIDMLDAQTDKELSSLNESRDNAMGAVKKAGAAVKKQQAKIAGLKDKHAKQKKEASTLADPDAKKNKEKEAAKTFAEMRFEEKQLSRSEELQEFKEANAAVHQIDAKISNKNAVKEKLGGMRGNIDKAKAIKARAANNVTVDSKAASRPEAHKELAKLNPSLMAKAGKAQDDLRESMKAYGGLKDDFVDGRISQYKSAIASGDMDRVEDFVNKHYKFSGEERKTSEVEKSFDSARSVEDFDKFVKKYESYK